MEASWAKRATDVHSEDAPARPTESPSARSYADGVQPSDRALDQPHPSRLDPSAPSYARILDAHRAALAAGDSGYEDPVTGLFVFTAQALIDQGECCDSGCRHCPYV